MEKLNYYQPLSAVEDIDVLVVGGGFAGVSAALRAARLGKKVLLAEHCGCLGGIGTSGMVNCFSRFLTKGTGRLTNGGLFAQYLEASRIHFGKEIICDYFDGEWMKSYFDRQLRDAGVRVLLNSTVFAVSCEEKRIVSVSAATMYGPVELRAKAYVDATGDGTLSVLAGCGYMQGDENGRVQAATLMARFSDIPWEKLLTRPQMKEIWKRLSPDMALKNKAKNLLLYTVPPRNTVLFNTTCLTVTDPTDPFEVSEALMEGREQIRELLDFCRENLPGMENADAVSSANILGVRESRRIYCLYTVTEKDLMEARAFDDQIARGCYSMDIHQPDGSISMMRIPEGKYYTIPYRAIVAAERQNLLVAGRCMGATHNAIGALRIMPIAACTGEAAGVAAALAAAADGNAHTLDVGVLQQELKDGGSLICEVPCPEMQAEIC